MKPTEKPVEIDEPVTKPEDLENTSTSEGTEPSNTPEETPVTDISTNNTVEGSTGNTSDFS